MKYVYRFLFVALFVLMSSPAAAAASDSLRHDIEVFLSTGAGTIVFFLLLLLIMLWLLLPLAVFGLKRKLREISREIRETNCLLSEIRDVLGAIGEEETVTTDSERKRKHTDPDMADLYDQIRFDP